MIKGKFIDDGKSSDKADTISKGKSTDKRKRKLDATEKGKGKVDVAEKDNVEVPPFVDSDYYLSDKDEDDIMVAQVEG